MRSEFGFERTTCNCRDCVENCRRISGSLIPNDLKRLLPGRIADALPWAFDNLLASPGALVVINGNMKRIPTIVPKRLSDGACKFLVNNLCAIHENAPYGCAFFGHMPKREEDERSCKGLRSILEASELANAYKSLWTILYKNGHRARPPEAIRAEWTKM